jgi:cholesterol transport system auxiliary component
MTAVTSWDRASATDRILTVQPNGEVAYIKSARWVSGAPALFDQALQRAFDADEGPARIITRGQMGRSDYVLKVDVRRFEARYDNGADFAPTINVEVRAALTRSADRIVAGERLFRASVPASENRVGPIAAAFDKAVAEVVGQMVAWVDAKGA